MKKFNFLKWIIPIAIIFCILIIFMFVKLTNKQEKLSEKVDKELDYLGNNLISISNKLNNITFNNYRVTKTLMQNEGSRRR